MKFYTKMKIYGGRANFEVPDKGKNPDWIITRRQILGPFLSEHYTKYLKENINPKNYEVIMIDYPDIPFENRETPMFHHYYNSQKCTESRFV